jgi:cytochrome c553
LNIRVLGVAALSAVAALCIARPASAQVSDPPPAWAFPVNPPPSRSSETGPIARGQRLVALGDGAEPCRSCHGPELRGVGNVPPLAGRSPSYLARQLYDFKHGTRRGPAVAPMLPEVATMTPSDRIAIVAYLASLPP